MFKNIDTLLWHLYKVPFEDRKQYIISYLKSMRNQYERVYKNYKGCPRTMNDKNKMFVLIRDLSLHVKEVYGENI